MEVVRELNVVVKNKLKRGRAGRSFLKTEVYVSPYFFSQKPVALVTAGI